VEEARTVQLFDLLLRARPVPASAPADWWRATAAVRGQLESSIERAIALGAHADRLGQAFLGGYASAITALDPTLGSDELGALCATEAGGGHPRAILTTLADGKLDGTKHFVSGGSLATMLLVVAKVGEEQGRPALKLARIGAKSRGVVIEDGTPLDFIPEVPHGAVTFTAAPVDAVLEGDGYEKYLKPFRTIEDLHIFGAVLGCVLSNGREHWSPETVERLLSLIASIAGLGRGDPSSPGVHLALAGVLANAQTMLDALDWSALDRDFVARFERDRPLLRIAGRVREQRRVRAWSQLGRDV
jgi:acyl-CoA dehydrogenase